MFMKISIKRMMVMVGIRPMFRVIQLIPTKGNRLQRTIKRTVSLLAIKSATGVSRHSRGSQIPYPLGW